ncbi:MAG TPA: DUF3619 family protein [Rhodocyclaceae bacterium]|jgi:hypothetical protein|nr:DUF3619 family protein [Rhodocyclaceae bacterium]
MNEELQFARKLTLALNHSTDALDDGIGARLHMARTAALERQRQPSAMLSLAGLGNLTTDLLRSNLAPTMLAFALMIGAAGAVYVDNVSRADENAKIDSALLSDALPINAYLDDGFQLWVESSSPSSD